mgnify:CR=1 FL=1
MANARALLELQSAEGSFAAYLAALERAVERGELRDDLDYELALDFLGGPLFYRLLITGGPLDEGLSRGQHDRLRVRVDLGALLVYEQAAVPAHGWA